ncbi:hypothetical protein [Acinetobacter seifertii]|uniref:hypothetical protein n=1 Tax=Acinetobacter seifertii TaxID=1530123 RepID=UPI00124E95E2|nr:hypothetical protein [Acinetobacter seifertii]
MFEKFNDKIETIEYVFKAYPKVYYRLTLFTVLTVLLTWFYCLGLTWLMSLQVFYTYPLFSFISENYDLLRWGGILVPLVVAIYGINDVIDLYKELKMRKYGR